jgi:DNA-binding SARP family transcriptional activator
MTHLSLKLLGQPEARYGGQVLKFRSRKVLALLIYLAVEGGEHGREKLIALLWPDSEREQGQASLRNTLARLRQALGEAETYLTIEKEAVSFDLSRPFDLDLRLIQTAVQSIQETAKLNDPSPLSAALAAYGGDFLEGFSLGDAPDFDHWASQQREAWHQRLTRIFNRLSRWQFEAGQVDEAIDTTARWIAHDSLNEAAYRRLMQLQALSGNRTAALQAYEQCRRILAEELHVEPESETVELAERIRRMKEEGGRKKEAAAPASFGELPFVGRVDEHRRLVTAYQAAAQGQMQVMCVIGEAGIGKTRLSQTFLGWAAMQGGDLLRGRAFEAGGQLPYQPLVDALRERLERENAPDDLLADVWLAELSQLLPELRERYPDLPALAPGDPALARSRLFEAVAQLGQALAARRPVVLFIDDLQWADAATLEILPYLARRWAGSRLLLLLTLRDEALTTLPGLREWLSQLERETKLARLGLSPLTMEATGELVRALAEGGESGGDTGGDAASDFVPWLYAETAGQPFFMAETLKMLIEQNILRSTHRPDGHWAVAFESALGVIRRERQLPMPPNVREVILSRLGRLSESATSLLAAGAVLGRASSYERLCQVAGVEELGGLSALDELLKSRLLFETADTAHPYTFAHDKIRDVAYTEAGDARRRLYHRRALVALQAESAPSAELAHHALAARYPEPAFRYSVAAGDEAAGVYAHAEAIAHYGRALEIAKQDRDGVTGEKLAQLFLRLGRSLELSSQYPQALIHYREMEALADGRGDRAMGLAALMAQITPLATVNETFDPAQAERIAGRALGLARELGDGAAEAKILWNQLILYRNVNRLPQAIASGERALRLARQLNLREQLAYVLHDLGYCRSFMAEFGPAKVLFAEAVELWRALGNLPMLGDSLVGICLVGVFTGEYESAIASFEEALQISQTLNSLWGLAGSRHNIGLAFADRGEVAKAITVMEEGIRLSEEVGFISPLIVVRADLAGVYGDLGAFERALELARTAVQVAETKMPVLRVYALDALARLALAQRRIAEAQTWVEQMKADPNRDGWRLSAVLIPQTEGELALAQGDGERARMLAEEAVEAVRRCGARALLPRALLLSGRAWLSLGEWERARDLLREARAEAEAIGSRRTLWKILSALSELEADPAEAERLQAQAREVVDYIAGRTPGEWREGFGARVGD